MTRSRKRKLQRLHHRRPGTVRALAASVPTLLAGMSAAYAQTTTSGGLEEIIVTAQKRTEDIQNVPISIQALGNEKLDQLNIKQFDDYVKFLPSVTYQTFGPGFAYVYMRGISSGGDGNHSGSLPSVGIYLDEQPITTIQGALDVNLYDIERVEALEGPQGTLYGASSQAGTLRIITNKPDPAKFKAGYDLEANAISGDMGYVAEGFVNLPINDRTAVRLVGWARHDGGYIDNVSRQRTYKTSGAVADSTHLANDNNNDVDVTGGRGSLKIDLNDNWTVTPQLMTQYTKANGNFAYDTSLGEMKVAKVRPEFSEDRFTQAALTVEGKIGNFDLIYAGAYLKRNDYTESDYSDYSYWYDKLLDYGTFWYNDAGDYIDPTQYIHGKDKYNRSTHELRISSDPNNRFRFVAGLFWQRQEHDIQQRYLINDLASYYSVTDWPDTIWLTKQLRVDKDSALFGEVTFDFTDHLTGTAGVRFFDSNNSLKGFFGFSGNYSSNSGEAQCPDGDPATAPDFEGAPCKVFDKTTKENDYTPRVNLTYKFVEGKMVYATYSEGYRPGGINRRGTLPPYISDWLKNYEVGWKTMWLDNRIRFNGAVFDEKWDDIQFSVLGLNGLTEIRNAGGAEVKGVEMDLTWAITDGLSLSAATTYLDAKLTDDYCGTTTNGKPDTHCDVPQAPDGTQLPVTADWKGNATARYQFNLANFNSFVQGSVVYVGEREADMRILAEDDHGLYGGEGTVTVPIRQILGKMPSYTTFDFSAGIGKDSWSLEAYATNAFDERGQVSRFAQCLEEVCKDEIYVVPIAPRTIGLKFSQNF